MGPTRFERSTMRLEALSASPPSLVGLTSLDNNSINLFIVISQWAQNGIFTWRFRSVPPSRVLWSHTTNFHYFIFGKCL